MSFDVDLSRFTKDMGLELDTVVRKVALDAHNRVTQKTPVDKGRAKANWNVGTGAVDYTTSESTTIQRPTLNKGDGKRPVYITNNLPYIHKLEQGSSKQAPSGMVAVTMMELQRVISRVVRH